MIYIDDSEPEGGKSTLKRKTTIMPAYTRCVLPVIRVAVNGYLYIFYL